MERSSTSPSDIDRCAEDHPESFLDGANDVKLFLASGALWIEPVDAGRWGENPGVIGEPECLPQ